jgi:hypothetical protein
MAKGKSKKPTKSRAVAPVSVAKRTKTAASRGVRKHLRQLERQLSDAARQERKRLRKLERATFRRQMLQAALEELRGETIVVVPTAVESPASAVAVDPVAKARPAARATAPAKPRPTTSAAVTAKPRPTAKPRTAAGPRPAAKPRPAAVRTRTTRATTASAKAAPKATPESPAAQKATD